MSYQVINPFIQFVDQINGKPLSGGSVYFGRQDSDPKNQPANRINVYAVQDNGSEVLLAQPITLNGAGQPQYSGSVKQIKVELYAGESAYCVQVFSSNGSQKGYSARVYSMVDIASLAATNSTVLIGGAQAGDVGRRIKQTISVKDFPFLATGNGVTNDGPAIRQAIAAAKPLGFDVFIPAGNYLILPDASSDSKGNGFVLPYTDPNATSSRVSIYGQGKSTVLLAGANNMVIARMSDSHCSLSDMTINGNGFTGVWGVGLIPQNLNSTTTLSYQLFNNLDNLYIINCDDGIVFRTGGVAGGLQSGCWYNYVSRTTINFCKRGIWLADCPAGSSGSNRNVFDKIRIGQGVNTGIQIDDADTCKFYALNLEGINSGTIPNATPTAIKIKNSGASGLDNNNNVFMGFTIEAASRSIENANTSTEFYGAEIGSPYNAVFTARPRVLIGGDPSLVPQILPAYTYQSNGQFPDVPNVTLWPSDKIRSKDGFFTDTQKLQSVAIGSLGAGVTSFNVSDPIFNKAADIDLVIVGGSIGGTEAISLTAKALCRWNSGGSLIQYGISAVSAKQSRGASDYVDIAGFSLSLSSSSNSLICNINNTSGIVFSSVSASISLSVSA